MLGPSVGGWIRIRDSPVPRRMSVLGEDPWTVFTRRSPVSPKQERRWYKAGLGLCLLAMVAAALGGIAPRLTRSASFALTLMGFLAVTWPSWDKHGVRLRMLGMSFGVLATEFAVLWAGLARD